MSARSKIRRLASAATDFIRSDRKINRLRNCCRWRIFDLRLRKQSRLNRAFDARFGTDTASEVVLVDSGVPVADAAQGNNLYRPMFSSSFHAAMKRLPLNFSEFTFVDLGSGKVKMIMLAADYNFKHIVGVEYSLLPHKIAAGNFRTYSSLSQKCSSFEPILGNVLDYQLPSGSVVCMIFNSFAPDIMRRAMHKLGHDAGSRADPVFVIYSNLRNVNETG